MQMWPTDKDLLLTHWQRNEEGRGRERVITIRIIATNDRWTLSSYPSNQLYPLFISKWGWIIKLLPLWVTSVLSRRRVEEGRGSHIESDWHLANGHLVEQKRRHRFNKGGRAGQPKTNSSIKETAGILVRTLSMEHESKSMTAKRSTKGRRCNLIATAPWSDY